jgi:hypothetical protein
MRWQWDAGPLLRQNPCVVMSGMDLQPEACLQGYAPHAVSARRGK